MANKTTTFYAFTAAILLFAFLLTLGFVFVRPDLLPQGEPQDAYLNAYYSPVSWQELPGFTAQSTDNQDTSPNLQSALLRSCRALLDKPADSPLMPARHVDGELAGLRVATTRAWWPFCAALQKHQQEADVSEVSIYLLLKEYLQPYIIKQKNKYLSPFDLSPLGLSQFDAGKLWPETAGLFTGYYAPVVPGSHFRTAVYNVPLYGMPADLLVADLGDFHPDLAGRRLVARAEDGRLVPYHDRAAIDNGALASEPLLWLKDPIDKFFLQIQGSGQVILPSEETVFVGYAAANGQPYTAIGRYLVAEGYMDLEDVTMQSIRRWLEAHPEHLTEVLHQNESYVFFRQRADGPYGSQGVLLTPQRALAVDRRVVPLGAPVFLDSTVTATGEKWQKLMVAQDTGGAIKGAIRGDIYFGAGETPARLAGHQKSPGRLFVLLPKEISVTNGE